MLICSSEEAVETFIAHCDDAVRDLLLRYGDLVIVLSTLLRIRRTLDSAEIDKIIRDFEAQGFGSGASSPGRLVQVRVGGRALSDRMWAPRCRIDATRSTGSGGGVGSDGSADVPGPDDLERLRHFYRRGRFTFSGLLTADAPDRCPLHEPSVAGRLRNASLVSKLWQQACGLWNVP
jgi:hypothetical protein